MIRLLISLVGAVLLPATGLFVLFQDAANDEARIMANGSSTLSADLFRLRAAERRLQGDLEDHAGALAGAYNIGAKLEAEAHPPAKLAKKRNAPELPPAQPLNSLQNILPEFVAAHPSTEARDTAEWYALLNGKGEVIASTFEGWPTASTERNQPVVIDALSGIVRHGVVWAKDRLNLVVAYPTVGSDGANGVVLAGLPGAALCTRLAERSKVSDFAYFTSKALLCSYGSSGAFKTTPAIGTASYPRAKTTFPLFVDGQWDGWQTLGEQWHLEDVEGMVAVATDLSPGYLALATSQQQQLFDHALASVPLILLFILLFWLTDRQASRVADYLSLLQQGRAGSQPVSPLNEREFSGVNVRLVRQLNNVLAKVASKPEAPTISSLLQGQDETAPADAAASNKQLPTTRTAFSAKQAPAARLSQSTKLASVQPTTSRFPSPEELADFSPTVKGVDSEDDLNSPFGGLNSLKVPPPPPVDADHELPLGGNADFPPEFPPSESEEHAPLPEMNNSEASSALDQLDRGFDSPFDANTFNQLSIPTPAQAAPVPSLPPAPPPLSSPPPPLATTPGTTAASPPPPAAVALSPLVSGGASAPTSDEDEEAQFQAVFAAFKETREKCGEAVNNLTYDKFAEKLKKSREQVMQKQVCKTVSFEVYVKDGKAALKAIAVR